MKNAVRLVLIVMIILIATPVLAEESEEYTMLEHPFMLANQSRLSKLSKLGNEEPWKTLKKKAIMRAKYSLFNQNASYEERCDAVRLMASYNCTAFIMDPENANEYKERILEAISYFGSSHDNSLYAEIYTTDGDNWIGSVPPANAFATCVVALDIIYPELTEAEINAAESALEGVATKFWNAMERHYQNVWGLRGLWAAYKQDYSKLQQCYDEWLVTFDDNFSSDGGQLSSNEYNYWRHASSQRTAKILLPFVTEYMGFTNGFFENEKYINAMEYTLGYTSTPTGQWWIFGDSMLGGAYSSEEVLGAYFAHYFSETAAEYGSFMVDNDYGAGEVLKLLLGRDDGTLAEPTAPKSRIFPETAAFLYDDYESKNALAGVLYSSTQYSKYNGHKHKESNSIGLYAYGSMLMANSGYNFFWNGIDGYSWDYIQQRAISANTVLINYEIGDIKNPSDINDHTYLYTDDYTNGIKTGFINDLFSFARADSGKALPNGIHERTLALVPSQDGVPGYYVMFDNVITDQSGDVVTVVHRPMSVTYTTLSEREEYEYKINYELGKGVDLTLFMVNRPNTVEFVDGVVAGQASKGNEKHIKSLLAKYDVGDDKNLRAATILFPSNKTNIKPEITSLDIEGAYGAKLDFGEDIRDFIFTSKKGEHTYHFSGSDDELIPSRNNLVFDGRNVIIRRIKDVNVSMFAEDVQFLKTGDEGFISDLPINVFMKNMEGNIETEASTVVTFFQYGIEKVLYNGEVLENIDHKPGSVTVVIPEGIGEIELICDGDNLNP